jgi:hypothetical protein
VTVRSSAFFALLALACPACGVLGNDDPASDELSLVTSIQCSVPRGAFVARTPSGDLTITCPGARPLTLNGETISDRGKTGFSVRPHDGVNILQVERGEGEGREVTDIPFLFGNFKDPRALVADAIAVRVGGAGMSSGPVRLPLPATPSALTLSQIASQSLRDQRNVLAAYDGTGQRIEGFGFSGSVKVVRSTYDNRSVTVAVTPRAGGVHVEADIASAATVIGWEVGVAGLAFGDEITASVAKVHAGADVDLAYDAGTRSIRGRLGASSVRVEGTHLDSAALSRIPFGLADGLEDAISFAAEELINGLAAPLLDVIGAAVVPDIAFGIEKLNLPKKIDLPLLGGSVDLAQSFDGASFDAAGAQISLAAAVTAPAAETAATAPGFLTRPTGRATFDRAQPYAASVSVDYVNQALFAVWKRGLLNRQVSGPISQFGISTDAIVSNAKLPPVVFPRADGSGLQLHLGEIELTTVFHTPNAGAAKVRMGVTLIAGAKIALTDGGATLTITPTDDESTTKFVAELIGVPSGNEAAAAELVGIVKLMTPVIEAIIAHDFVLPPIAIPQLDLGLITPGFAGRHGRFDGALEFDAATSRIGVDGSLIAF